MRPIRATIDLAAMRHNLALARARAPRSRVWAVIKANAYGHGIERAASAFGAADGLAMVEIEAAVRLRERGIDKPMLLLEGFFDASELPEISRHGLVTAIHSMRQVAMLEQAALSSPVAVYLKLNTGMNRLGFDQISFIEALARLRACRNAGDLVLMTHFADADGARGVGEQMARLEGLFSSAAGQAAAGLPRSLANSAATLRHPQTHGDWVRPGIMLYGCSPFEDQSAEAIGLRPAMTLTSEIIGVQRLQAGDRVGYGGTYTAAGPLRVGIVACGYADGYPRQAPNGTPVLVEGTRVPTAGRVSMDLLFVDLSTLPNAGIGSPVTLWGKGLTADEVARCAGTVSYELLCALATRVPVRETR